MPRQVDRDRQTVRQTGRKNMWTDTADIDR